MRVLVFLLCLMVTSAQAQWVAFTPCGLKATEDVHRGYEAFTGSSPNLSVVYIWAPQVMAIVGFPEAKEDDAECALILVPGNRIYVVGSAEEVRGWLENE